VGGRYGQHLRDPARLTRLRTPGCQRRTVGARDFHRVEPSDGGCLCFVAHREDDAIEWLWRAATETGKHSAAEHLARLLADVGRIDDAVLWYQKAACLGAHEPLNEAASTVTAAGRDQEGTQMRRYRWEPDGSIAAAWEALLPN
jgi:hypothetical protein